MQQENVTMKSRQLLRLLTIFVFIAGFSLRIAKANELPLDHLEASLAMSADALFEGNEQISQPFYTVITGVMFWVFEESNLLARILPILVGSLLIWIPWIAGEWLSDRTKFILSIALALDPALMAASKTAGSQIIAVAGLLLSILLFLKKKPIGTGVSLAVFFMSGSAFIPGGLSVGLAMLWIILRHDDDDRIKKQFKEFPWRAVLLSFAISYVMISSAFFTQPSGIGSSFQDLATIFDSTSLQPIPLGIMAIVLSLLVYEFVPLLFAIWGVVTNRQEPKLWMRLCLWISFFSFIVLLFNPGRTALNLVWLSVPLWLLATEQIDRLLEGFNDLQPISLAVGLFFLLMIGFVLFTFVGAVNVDGVNFLNYPEETQPKLLIRGLLIVGGLLLVGITYFLAGYTWYVKIAQNALMIGVGFYLLVFGLFEQSWHAAFLGVHQESEIWHQSSVLIDGDRILETIEDISEMNHGQRINQPITFVGIESPALEWHLREQDIQIVQGISGSDNPEMMITYLGDDSQIWGAEYTGQDFRLSTTPSWSLVNWQEWLSWIVFHDVEITTDEMAILWVRTDLFPGQTSGE
jgi:hypothetical protein